MYNCGHICVLTVLCTQDFLGVIIGLCVYQPYINLCNRE